MIVLHGYMLFKLLLINPEFDFLEGFWCYKAMLFKESLEPCLPISHLLAHDFLLAFHQGMGPEKVAQHMKKPYETMVKLGHNHIYIYIIINIYIYIL